nr:uncharacterized protein LOC129441650 [Misgurnus anguillicaudatus]
MLFFIIMAEDHHYIASFIILFLSNTGFSTEDTVFVMTGDSVQLDIQSDSYDFYDIAWKNEKSENVVKYFSLSKEIRHHPSYKGRVAFNTESLSLTLKNMKKTDSGVYRAIASGASDKLIAEHRVSVIGNEIKNPTPSGQSNIVFSILMLVVVVGAIVFCNSVFYCCFKNGKDVQNDDNADYEDVESFKTLARTQMMSEDTWTSVTYSTI